MRLLPVLMLAIFLVAFAEPAHAADCCTPQGTPGCDDPNIEGCVCAGDGFCCTDMWDDQCVEEVEQFGCGSCAVGGCGDGVCSGSESCVNCPNDCGGCQGSGDCCLPNGTPGCQNVSIANCVCAGDAWCCSSEWDDQCVEEVTQFGCGVCQSQPACGDFQCTGEESCVTCPADCGSCQGSGDCCQPNGTPGCQDANIAGCVCGQDGWCCSSEWDQQCVDEVTQFGCGVCDAQPTCGDGACAANENCIDCPQDCGDCTGPGDCCEDTGTPGCQNAAVAQCVCAQDLYCCMTMWDGICAGEVVEFGCGSCEGPAGCDDGNCANDEDCLICPEDCGWCPGVGDCCEPNGSPGCDKANVQECVCDQDLYCCESEWDYTCAAEVESFACGECLGGTDCGDGICAPGETCALCPEDCGPCGGSGDCCEPHDGPGCDDPTVQACVCKDDSFCCEYTWDEVCVEEVKTFGCGDCEGGGCGNGACDGIEDCLTCPEDCGACEGTGCCQAHPAPGCDDQGIQNCVCEDDAYCCEEEWDGVCVDEVDGLGCGSCGGQAPVCGNGQCESGESCEACPQDCGECPGTGDCCQVHQSPGCNDPSIQNCVCQKDAYCCQTNWDDTCVEDVESENCGSCGGCVPDCTEKECGGDGCGGSCGQCPANQSCTGGGKCKDSGGCQPECAGKECGDDGCGGTCGQCAPGEACHNGKCKQNQCTPQCQGKQCGPDGCGGQCGQCPAGQFCMGSHCKKECKPDCTGKQCGSDGCGGSCGTCPAGTSCNPGGHCASSCTPHCGGKQCGPDGCGGSCGTCPAAKTCSNGHCSSTCQPDCAGKKCGPDGCGGECGQCPAGATCNNQGHCLIGCTPDCTGKQCGTDGCGGTCGKCGFDEQCNDQGKCDKVCVPDCLNKECGPDGCDGQCGNCGFDQTCTDKGICGGCEPDCAGKARGDDGCSGQCGTCTAGLECDAGSGMCVPEGTVQNPEQDADAVGGGVTLTCLEGEMEYEGECVPVEEWPSSSDSGCFFHPSKQTTSTSLRLFLLFGLILGMTVVLRRPERR